MEIVRYTLSRTTRTKLFFLSFFLSSSPPSSSFFFSLSSYLSTSFYSSLSHSAPFIPLLSLSLFSLYLSLSNPVHHAIQGYQNLPRQKQRSARMSRMHI